MRRVGPCWRARTVSMERYGEAAGAYAKATELTPNNADLWAEYAFASAMASGRKSRRQADGTDRIAR